MDQGWFEMKNIRQSDLAKKAWIPVRAAQDIECVGKPGSAGFREDRLRVVSLAVPTDNRSDALTLGWNDIGIGYDHAGCVDTGQYIPADVYRDDSERFVGLNLVLSQRASGAEQSQWHLHQDFVVTLGLKREDDKWVRPEEDYIEVARMRHASDGSPTLLEVRPSHLQDYLGARAMGLVVSSFRIRSEITTDAAQVSWGEDEVEEKGKLDRWVGRRTAIDERGGLYGESVHVTHVKRTDVNPEDDVPVLGLPTDANLQSKSWTKKFCGTKLFRISGELWRTEWLGPASQSPIVRGDRMPKSVSFIIDAEGKQATADEFVDSGRWLWFNPKVVPALIDRRGGSLRWYSRDTGAVACSPTYDVHFGVNAVGFVNAYMKAVALLPEWQQREWAAHNTYPEGKLSEELKASQIDASPASTVAPEAILVKELDRLQELAQAKLKIKAQLAKRMHCGVIEATKQVRGDASRTNPTC